LVQLHCPLAPASLVQTWVQQAYDELVGKRHWAWLRKEYLLTTLASRSLSVGFTQGSTAITSAALFVASDAGRQIRVGTSGTPTYTIDTVTNASAAVLTAAYQDVSGSATATISDIYLPMPTDFRSFEAVVDPTIQRPIAWWIARDRLDLFDPGRVSYDTRLRVLASYQLSQATATLGQLLYEAWPHPTAAGTYVIKYFARSDSLADDDVFKGVLATKTQALIDGALAKCARWPGTTTQKNPYFGLGLALSLEGKFQEACQTLDVMDDDQYLMDLMQVDLAKYGLAALSADTTLMRQSDATTADYFGG
jgi:hypothetical protein